MMSNEATAKTPYMDWQQVVLNGGPPCFAVLDAEENWYCGRAQRWDGHDYDHKYVSLSDLLDKERVALLAEVGRLREALELLQGFDFRLDDSAHGKEIRRRAEVALSGKKEGESNGG